MKEITDIETLNWVVNRPEVLPHLAPGFAHVSLAPFFDKPRNVAFGDERGALLFGWRGGGEYEMHYCFTSRLRGKAAFEMVKEALFEMFTNRGATAIVGATPRENRAARAMNRALGAIPVGTSVDSHGRECINYSLKRPKWATS